MDHLVYRLEGVKRLLIVPSLCAASCIRRPRSTDAQSLNYTVSGFCCPVLTSNYNLLSELISKLLVYLISHYQFAIEISLCLSRV
jgi:hypothetical protein